MFICISWKLFIYQFYFRELLNSWIEANNESMLEMIIFYRFGFFYINDIFSALRVLCVYFASALFFKNSIVLNMDGVGES